MTTTATVTNQRLLVVDDNRAIHEDIKKILVSTASSSGLDALEAELFGEEKGPDLAQSFDVESAYQGQEAAELVDRSLEQGRPYAVAFVDMRMPPGWDGIETIEQLWKRDPELEIVICSAYSDHSWAEIAERVGKSDRLLILKKPFDVVEIVQLAHALSTKWSIRRELGDRMARLDDLVEQRTHDIEKANEQLEQQMKDRERMEVELRLAQKLEAVGQLAAGIAHEINNPIQYVGSSVHFLKSAFDDYQNLFGKYRDMCAALADSLEHATLVKAVREAEEAADLEYLEEHVPRSFSNAFDGIDRVANIVNAVKEFAHPDQREKSHADLNKAISNTLTVARNEYKYVAEVETDLGELPPVLCHLSDLNQVFINLVVNAAHAIADKVGESKEMGTIRIASSCDEKQVVITIADSGSGIPAEVQERVFDPFFTTKEVGKGTGQGLAIARSIVVDKHNGTLDFETEAGVGTKFTIILPLVSGIADSGDSS